ncbi:MAG: TetR/AcrR family transcriptional regulator [Dehalococcoidales bacterium]|nr:TetR/AcrR family transcriptional regulator [Dehalococcoidales bacterium]
MVKDDKNKAVKAPKTTATKSINRRNEIVTIALHLFVVKGYETTSMGDIAEACMMSKGNFYNYFKAKDDLVSAITDRAVDDFNHELQQLPPRLNEMGPTRTMEYYLSTYIDTVKNKEHAYNFLNHVAANLPMEKRLHLFQVIDQLRNVFETILNAGTKKKEFRNIDTKIVSMDIVTMCNAWAQYNWYVQKVTNFNKYKKEQIAFILKAIQPE